MTRRSIVLLAGLATLLVGAVILAGPRSTSDTGPGGTLALRRLLRLAGRDVRAGATLPGPPGTFVLLADLRTEDQSAPILDWIREGGRLVLADPGSLLAGRLSVDPDREAPSGRLRPGCAAPEVRGVGAIEALGNAGLGGTSPAAVTCFVEGEGALLVVRDVGRGRAVVLGDVSPFTNELLRRADNAILALQTIPSDGPVVFGPPLPPGAAAPGRGVWASLPLAARASIAQLVAALAVFALVRGRRFGHPVLEDPLAPIPAGELVRATGRLYRRARVTGFAGRELRRAMIGRLGRRVGAPSGSASELAALLARAGAGRERELGSILAGPDPTSDDELIALGREVEEVRRRVEESP